MKTATRKRLNAINGERRSWGRSYAIKAFREREEDAPIFNVGRHSKKRKNPKYRGLPLPKPKYKNWSVETLLPEIRQIVLKMIAAYHQRPSMGYWLRAETIAKDLKAKLPLVYKCLMILNQEGLIHQRKNHFHSDGGWIASLYCIRVS